MEFNKRKKIGIVGWKVGDNSIGITTPYYEFFNNFGDIEILSPTRVLKELDLLVLPGGADVNPTRYKQKPHLMTGNINPVLEFFDVNVLPQYIKKGTPIFGICRGLQTLNVHFGGSLNQHISGDHEQSDYRTEKVHTVAQYYDPINNKQLNGSIKFKTNSMHHQAIRKLGEGLLMTLQCTKDGDRTIEGIRHSDYPIHAVQHHPEEIYDEFSIKTILKLLKIEQLDEKY